MIASLERVRTLTESERSAVEQAMNALRVLYGSRIKAVVLYGSKARGDADQESDIDLLAVIAGMTSRFQERRSINELVVPINLTHGVLISVFPVDAEFYESVKVHPFYRNIQAEGIVL